MQAVTVVTGTAVPLMRDSINTDLIIPATYMRRLTRTGYDDVLFEPLRNDPDFPLDQAQYAGASVLLVGADFGCGSSREHAPWALRDGGFRAIVAPSFADIFRSNCAQTGLLTVQLPRTDVERLATAVEADPRVPVTIDVAAATLSAAGLNRSFPIDAHLQRRLLAGVDPIDETLICSAEIETFERARPAWLPTVR
jgi:3-isopropylmalate/(R)-2-methylmalate dehydratase small subunit